MGNYDVIVVGARCAGSPTAMLLARQGHRVLLVDKATFPSDTMSTHLVHPPGVAALARWDILDALVATGCPPIRRYSFDFGPVTVAGAPRAADGTAAGTSYGPRRHVLDALLVDAAVAAGAELREGFTVDEVLFEDGRAVGIRGHAKGGEAVERAPIVVGADGKHSLVAKAVEPETYNDLPTLEAAYYAYWSGLPVSGFETFIRAENGHGWGALPTHDGLTCLVVGAPRAEFNRYRKDIEGTYLRALELAPEFAERVRAAKRETRFVGTGDLPNYFRKPYGPGWVLVGDAGYHRDPITAFGISDAFRDAETVAQALNAVLTGARSFDDAMAAYQRARDEESMPIYGFTTDFARIEPPPAEMQQLIGAVSSSQDTMDDFVSVMAGTMPAPEFFAPDNVGRIMAGAAAPA